MAGPDQLDEWNARAVMGLAATDGALRDFDEAMSRSRSYTSFERHAYEEACNLFKKEVE